MKTNQVTTYMCEICKEVYTNPNDATLCESKTVTGNKGVEVGDVVLVINGEGAGQRAKVTGISIVRKNWGDYAWEKYWHTIVVTAKLIDSFGSRTLLFDSYEPIQSETS